jgi:hypothetical protein
MNDLEIFYGQLNPHHIDKPFVEKDHAQNALIEGEWDDVIEKVLELIRIKLANFFRQAGHTLVTAVSESLQEPLSIVNVVGDIAAEEKLLHGRRSLNFNQYGAGATDTGRFGGDQRRKVDQLVSRPSAKRPTGLRHSALSTLGGSSTSLGFQLMTENSESVTWLLRFAVEWYLDHPGQQIPHEVWSAEVEAANDRIELWNIYFRTQVITNVQPRIIPALAAICTGASEASLLAVIKHHGIQCIDLENCDFSWDDYEGESSWPGVDGLLSLDSWRVTKSIVDAMCLDDQLAEKLAEHLEDYQDHDEFDIASLLTNRSNLWPSTKLNEYLSRIPSDSFDEGEIIPPIIGAATFKDVNVNFDTFSDDQILTMLDHSGNLTPGVVSENGFLKWQVYMFFSYLFNEAHESANYRRMIEAMNRIEDPARLAVITDRLLEAVADYDNDQPGKGEELLRKMRELLDANRFRRVLDSMVLRLNLLPVSSLLQNHQTHGDSSNASELSEFFPDKDQALVKLHEELKELAPTAFRKPHFKAIGTLVEEWPFLQDMAGIDLHQLLMKTLEGLEAYRISVHLDRWNMRTDEFVLNAAKEVGKLSQMVSKLDIVDYARFSGLSSQSKALLAGNGFDIKKFTGISNQDKGTLLSDVLGL